MAVLDKERLWVERTLDLAVVDDATGVALDAEAGQVAACEVGTVDVDGRDIAHPLLVRRLVLGLVLLGLVVVVLQATSAQKMEYGLDVSTSLSEGDRFL